MDYLDSAIVALLGVAGVALVFGVMALADAVLVAAAERKVAKQLQARYRDAHAWDGPSERGWR
jgi:hypothetical protein